MSVVEFPGLWNLKITVNRIAFFVFGLPIYWYGIFIAFAFLLAVLLAVRQSSKYGIEPDNILDVVLYVAPAGIIGARVYYIIFSWEEFKDNLLSIFDTRKGGLAIYGGIIAGLIAALIFAKVKKLNFLHLFDFGITYVPMAQAIGRWGNFINQEAYGINTSLPWGMTSDTIKRELAANAQKLSQIGINVDPSQPVHPTFLYESLWDLGIFLLLMWYRKRKKADGEVFFLYMIMYGIGRAWIESLRTDSLMLGNQRISQVLAIAFAIAFTALLFIRRKHKDSARESEVYELGSSNYGALLRELMSEEEKEKAEDAEIEEVKEAALEDAEKAALEDAEKVALEDAEKVAMEDAEKTVIEKAEKAAMEYAGKEAIEEAEEEIEGNAEDDTGGDIVQNN